MKRYILALCLVLVACSSPDKDLADENDIKPDRDFQSAQPEIDSKRVIYGAVDAPVTIVEYGDFQCPACSLGAKSLKTAMEKHPGKVRFIFKHIPLAHFPYSKSAAQAFEILRAKDPKKAYALYESIYEFPGKLKTKEDLDKILKDFKVNQKTLDKSARAVGYAATVEKDRREFVAFGFRGTPVFIVNGEVLEGAPQPEALERAIQDSLAKGED